MALEGFSLLLSYDAIFISSNIYFYELKLLAALLQNSCIPSGRFLVNPKEIN
jgi:hypothetical protein